MSFDLFNQALRSLGGYGLTLSFKLLSGLLKI